MFLGLSCLSALLPFNDPFDTSMMDPFNQLTQFEPMTTLDPFLNRFNIVPRSMRRSMLHMDRELGKLLSSVKEDDKSFLVKLFVIKLGESVN